MRVDYLTCDYCDTKLGLRYESISWAHLGDKRETSEEMLKDHKRLDFCNIQCLVSYFNKLLT